MKEHIFNKFIDNVLRHTSLTKEELFSKTKSNEIVFARQTLFYLCSKRGLSTNMIKKYLENNGSDLAKSPIIYGISQIEKKLEEDRDLQEVINKLSVVD